MIISFRARKPQPNFNNWFDAQHKASVLVAESEKVPNAGWSNGEDFCGEIYCDSKKPYDCLMFLYNNTMDEIELKEIGYR